MTSARNPFLTGCSDGDTVTLFANNLVHSLPGELVLVGEVTERHAAGVLLGNHAVACRVGGRPGLERSPLPTGDAVECVDPVLWEQVLLVPLAAVGGEGPDLDVFAVHCFDVDRWDFGVAFSFDELGEGCEVRVETCGVVHIC